MTGSESIRTPKKYSVEKLPSSNYILILLSITFIAIGIYLSVTSQFLQDQNNSTLGFTIGISISIFAAVFFVSPIFTPNILTQSKLLIRYGLLFKLTVPIGNIKEAEVIQSVGRISMKGFIGTKYSILDRRYFVLRSRKNIIKITLKDNIFFGFPEKEIKELVIDCSIPDMLLRRISGDTG